MDTGGTTQGLRAKLTAANYISILRILAVPVFILLMVYYFLSAADGRPEEMYRFGALVVFAAASLSDALDGYVARSRHEVTRLGTILDPIADKALLLAAVVLLASPSRPGLEPRIPVWFSLVVISRDAVLIVGAFVINHVLGTVEVRPHLIGKTATVFQMATILWVLVGYRSDAFYVCAAIAGILTLISGLLYLVDGIRQIERSPVHRFKPEPPR